MFASLAHFSLSYNPLLYFTPSPCTNVHLQAQRMCYWRFGKELKEFWEGVTTASSDSWGSQRPKSQPRGPCLIPQSPSFPNFHVSSPTWPQPQREYLFLHPQPKGRTIPATELFIWSLGVTSALSTLVSSTWATGGAWGWLAEWMKEGTNEWINQRMNEEWLLGPGKAIVITEYTFPGVWVIQFQSDTVRG